MKKVTVAFLMLFIVAGVNAQDFKKININFTLGKLEEARTELDKILADPKTQNNAEAQLWKARIYGALYAEPATRAKYPESGRSAMDAFNKYMQLDPETKKLKEAGLGVIDQLYVTNFNLGRSAFDREQWDSAYSYFLDSYQVGEYITKQNWRNNNQALDTFTVLFTAYAAQNAKRLDDAAKYYQRFADLKIGGKDYESVYEFLGRHYLNQKNRELFNTYVTLGKELYPANKMWNNLEAAYLEDNTTLSEKLKLYEDAIAAGKMTADDYFNYGTMFANISKEDASKIDSMQLVAIKRKSLDAFKKTYELDNTNALAAYNAGVVLNNEWNELQERYYEYRGATPALKAKRDEIDRLSAPLATEAIEWFEKAFTHFDAKTDKNRVEKNSHSTAIKLLANLYEYKRDKAKGKSPADFDKFDKKFNFYASKVGN